MSLDSASEYALSFSEDAVHLQRREKTAGDAGAPGAWRHLGSVEFDSMAFHDEFALLRGMAQAEGAAADDAPLPVTPQMGRHPPRPPRRHRRAGDQAQRQGDRRQP